MEYNDTEYEGRMEKVQIKTYKLINRYEEQKITKITGFKIIVNCLKSLGRRLRKCVKQEFFTKEKQ